MHKPCSVHETDILFPDDCVGKYLWTAHPNYTRAGFFDTFREAMEAALEARPDAAEWHVFEITDGPYPVQLFHHGKRNPRCSCMEIQATAVWIKRKDALDYGSMDGGGGDVGPEEDDAGPGQETADQSSG